MSDSSDTTMSESNLDIAPRLALGTGIFLLLFSAVWLALYPVKEMYAPIAGVLVQTMVGLAALRPITSVARALDSWRVRQWHEMQVDGDGRR